MKLLLQKLYPILDVSQLKELPLAKDTIKGKNVILNNLANSNRLLEKKKNACAFSNAKQLLLKPLSNKLRDRFKP
jgi:hypothetical protein